ncbi:leucine-rich repeat protein [Perkinsela sp. CCAP 1560/4]|nr:leucine-rich repeat protein [Perkinsela sp. CCAP 1560/4]|eukprot:KNH09397.1 leucine-rich repeat protein [Perkinsela sp. CCAP 1560/4]
MSKNLCRFLENAISTNHVIWFCYSYDVWRSDRLHHLARWYNCRRKSYFIDKIPPSDELQRIIELMWESDWKSQCVPITENQKLSFPLVFVNKRCAGTYEAMLKLESQKRLQDLFQHHVRWPAVPLNEYRKPAPFNDEDAFRGIWKGHPSNSPIMPVPQFTTWMN